MRSALISTCTQADQVGSLSTLLRRRRAGSRNPFGTIERIDAVYSPELDNERDLLVSLPGGYATGERRFPVIYMHDGQNLFDPATSFSGSWNVDIAMAEVSLDGLDAIVVGIPNMGRERLAEYSPFEHPRLGGGKGQLYLDFLINTVKPLIDEKYLTIPDREHTGIVGSSMGGLISLYAFFRHPEIFGFAGVMSPSLWINEKGSAQASNFTTMQLVLRCFIGKPRTRREPTMQRANAIWRARAMAGVSNYLYGRIQHMHSLRLD